MFLLFTLRRGHERLWALSRFELGVTLLCFTLLAAPISLAALFKSLSLTRRSAAREAALFRIVVAAEWIRCAHAARGGRTNCRRASGSHALTRTTPRAPATAAAPCRCARSSCWAARR